MLTPIPFPYSNQPTEAEEVIQPARPVYSNTTYSIHCICSPNTPPHCLNLDQVRNEGGYAGVCKTIYAQEALRVSHRVSNTLRKIRSPADFFALALTRMFEGALLYREGGHDLMKDKTMLFLLVDFTLSQYRANTKSSDENGISLAPEIS